MHFASPISWWLAVLILAGISGLAWFSYGRPLVPLARWQRGVLISLRALTLLVLLFLLCRPVLLLTPATPSAVVIPVLVDTSRSMRTLDADGTSRIARAAALVRTALLPGLSTHAAVELFGFSDRVSPETLESLAASGRATDIAGAIEAVRARYRGRAIAGIAVLSDGANTHQGLATAEEPGPPVFFIGVGSADGLPDREVTSITAGDPHLDHASVDLHVSASTRGFGTAPFQLRVLANGQVIDTRRVVPAADGAPVDETFTVSPVTTQATVYRAEILVDPGDVAPENNARTLVVNPAGRKRRLLVLAGAPGFEHSFLVRALHLDPGFEVDSVVRKGKNDANQETFLVQAGGDRSATLLLGFPATREALFDYDALVIANLESDFFTRAQQSLVADFVSERGGGLLVLGGRSFERRGFMGTPIEHVLPLELNDRRGGAVRPPSGEEGPAPHDTLVLTEEGQRHPVMRLGGSPEESRKLWATLPSLASSAAVGGPRPGASVLAVSTQASGAVLPVVAVQRYGRGRSLMFAGEASWRWRMRLPATDRRFEFFWRQALRWLSTDSPEAVTIDVPVGADPGDPLSVAIDVRDRAFAPVVDALIEVRLTLPGGQSRPLPVRPTGPGRLVATAVFETAGLHRFHVEARKASALIGTADRWVYAGGAERELADPRLNEGFLRRMARESGGQYVGASDVSRVIDELQKAAPQSVDPVRRDLWHEPWFFALVIALLASEWILRRRWGLR